MKKQFYCLRGSGESEPHLVYGRPEWERQFGRADWSGIALGFSTGRLVPPYGEPQVDLTIVLPSPMVGDFVWTCGTDCIVTERTLALFRQAGFTGFAVRPVTVEKIIRLSRKRRDKVKLPPLWELLIIGKGGDAAPESGIYPLYEIGDSGRFSYSSYRNGIVVDETNWDGSDFCTVNGYPKHILVTERVKDLIIEHQLTNCALIPSHKLEWGSFDRPEELLEQTRALAARDLSSLLADLEGPDELEVMHTIYALGEKGDPRAIDALINKFTHHSHFVRTPAADIIAEIAKRTDVSEQVREETFSKLKNLLDDEDPLVREGAATAIGRMGGDRAAVEIVKLLEDPDDSVRCTAVSMMAFLHYKPALAPVKRLCRDRDEMVREVARLAVRYMSSEFP